MVFTRIAVIFDGLISLRSVAYRKKDGGWQIGVKPLAYSRYQRPDGTHMHGVANNGNENGVGGIFAEFIRAKFKGASKCPCSVINKSFGSGYRSRNGFTNPIKLFLLRPIWIQ